MGTWLREADSDADAEVPAMPATPAVPAFAADDPLQRNALLASLPDRELSAIKTSAEILAMDVRDGVYEPGGPILYAYFPLDCVFSLVGTVEERLVVEVATVGREGMVGLPLFLGASSSPHASFCQVPGHAARLAAGDLRRVLADDGAFHLRLNRFTQATMVQLAQNVICNASHSVEQRAARWLLITQDRVGREEFNLTQEFMSQMLAVQRPTVSNVAGGLQEDGVIRYRRGRMEITNRSALEARSCACYGVLRAEFDAITAAAG